MSAELRNIPKPELRDIPKDVFIEYILPHVQEPLRTENRALRQVIETMTSLLKARGITVCEAPGGCDKNIEGLYICNGCSVRMCLGHMVRKKKRAEQAVWSESWCQGCCAWQGMYG